MLPAIGSVAPGALRGALDEPGGTCAARAAEGVGPAAVDGATPFYLWGEPYFHPIEQVRHPASFSAPEVVVVSTSGVYAAINDRPA